MNEILIVADILSLPQECNFLERFQLDTVARHSLGKDVEDLITVLLILKCEIIRLLCDYLEADVAQLVPPLEQFADLLNLDLVY